MLTNQKTIYKKGVFFCYCFDKTICIELFENVKFNTKDIDLITNFLTEFEGRSYMLLINYSSPVDRAFITKKKKLEFYSKINSSLQYNFITLLLRQFSYASAGLKNSCNFDELHLPRTKNIRRVNNTTSLVLRYASPL